MMKSKTKKGTIRSQKLNAAIKWFLLQVKNITALTATENAVLCAAKLLPLIRETQK